MLFASKQLRAWLRSREIASFFYKHGFALPDQDGDAILDEALDYEDVKLKILQQEGYDAHDFNLFDDRSSQLWRKPYVDGAVRELTAGDSRTQEQMRQAVEQIMLAAGNSKPDVRYATRMTRSLPRRAHIFPRARGRGTGTPSLECALRSG